MNIYKHKPTIVKAMQFTKEYLTNLYGFKELFGKAAEPIWVDSYHTPQGKKVKVLMLHKTEVEIGSWIVQGHDNSLYAIRDGVFQSLYELVPNPPTSPEPEEVTPVSPTKTPAVNSKTEQRKRAVTA